MDYSVYGYIKRLPTQKLHDFLQQCEENGQTEVYNYIIPYVLDELAKRDEQLDGQKSI